MAKKDSSSSNKKVLDIKEIDNYLTSINSTGSLIHENKYINDQTFISTGIYILDALLSTRIIDGGIPSNKTTAIAGVSGTGKTYLALNIAHSAQKQGYFIIYIDTEGAIDINLTNSFSIDPNNFRIDPMSTVEEFKIYMAKLINKLNEARLNGVEIPKIMIILDSLGNLASSKEVEDATSGEIKAEVGSRFKQIKSVFRIITQKLNVLKIPFLLIGHTYMTMDMFPKEVLSGGTGAIYNASIILFLSKAKLKTGEEDPETDMQSGIVVTCRTEKNRLAKPKKIKFNLSFLNRADPYSGLDILLTPENFHITGIAKGKPVKSIDPNTGEEIITINPGGNYWYVRHLNKSVTTKQLSSPEVFTPEVLKKLDIVAREFFRYPTMEEIMSQKNIMDEEEKENTETVYIKDGDRLSKIEWLESGEE